MTFTVDPEPEPAEPILYVGQDRAGHWLVQEQEGRLEGRFISAEVAWGFARAECHAFPGARIIAAPHPLVAIVPFVPAGPHECGRGRGI